jgi:hypothetical protein
MCHWDASAAANLFICNFICIYFAKELVEMDR